MASEYTNVKPCSECGKEIRYLSTANDGRLIQPEDGIDITLSGGYGQFVDDWETGSLRLAVCKSCTMKLAEVLPSFKNWATYLGASFEQRIKAIGLTDKQRQALNRWD